MFSADDHILIKVNRQELRVNSRDIWLLEADDNYIRIFCTGLTHPLMIKGCLHKLEQVLPSSYFCRVHRSYIIGIQHVKFICRDLVNLGSKEVPLSKNYAAKLYSRFVVIFKTKPSTVPQV